MTDPRWQTVRNGLPSVPSPFGAVAEYHAALDSLEKDFWEYKYAAAASTPVPPDCWGLRQRAEKAQAEVERLRRILEWWELARAALPDVKEETP